MLFEPEIIGVNNRDLQTMEVDLKTSIDISSYIPPNVLSISESGISSFEEINNLRGKGYNAFLVGTSLMKSGYPGKALKELISNGT